MSISEATKKAVKKYPYLEQFMGAGVINNRALARILLPEISKQLGTTPNIQSVVSSLRRLPQSKGILDDRLLRKILSKSKVNLKYDMSALTLNVRLVDKTGIMDKLTPKDTYILLQGLETLTLIGEDTLIKGLSTNIHKKALELSKNLSIVIVESPKEITKTSGVLAHLANILALEEINIVEMMSSHAETAFIVEEKDALRTVEVLRKEIKRARTAQI